MFLKNSKTTQLSGNRFALDAFIGAVQMSEDGNLWEDIKPQLVRDTDGWHIEGAPYYAEVKDDGSRLFCPDRNEKSKYLRLSPLPLLGGIEKQPDYSVDVLTRKLISNRIALSSSWGKASYLFTNTGMYLDFELISALEFGGKSIDRFSFEVDTNLDIQKLIEAKEGLGITPARVVSGDEVRILKPTYKDRILEFGFDITGLKFPIRLLDAIDEQVAASGDDGYWYPDLEVFDNTGADSYVGNFEGYERRSWYRWDVTIPSGQQIDAGCYISLYGSPSSSGSPVTKITFDDQADPDAPADWADICGRTETTNKVDWDAVLTDSQWNNSSDIQAIIAELYASYDYSSEAAMQCLHKDDGGDSGDWMKARTYDNSSSLAAKLHIEYSAAGGWTNIAKVDGVASADIAKVNGVAVADIAKVNGVAV